ncbi:MAG: MlaD family protein [Treponema sp.]|jgi:phospholipid/cholesterol/gamma-HCH transport system substrate-binding protein|nr:MlaD family protein [Treponema sp.]
MNISRLVKVAIFFVTLGIGGSGYIVMSSNGLNAFNTKTYEVALDDASGLSTRSKIYCAGVTVGQIQGIKLIGNEAVLKVAFLKNVEIHSDARISRRASSILGTSALSLDPGTEFSPVIPAGSKIGAVKNTGDINAVMNTAQEVGGQVSEILTEFQENQLSLLASSLEAFNSIAQKVDSRSEVELDRISRILESTARITERTEQILNSRRGDLTESVVDIHDAIDNIKAITDEIRSGEGNVGKTIYDDKLYSSVLATTEKAEDAMLNFSTTMETITKLANNADVVIGNANEIVERAVGIGIQVDTQVRYDFFAAQARAGASLMLVPRSNDGWYRIGVSSAPNGIYSRTVREVTDSSGSVISHEDERLSFSIDAEIARRFGPVTIRGGLLESTAGFGIDFQPIRWASLSAELFDFTAEMPNLRGTITIYPFFDPDSNKPWNWLYVRGGINDALNPKRDFFIGIGLRFTDREVKGLVGLLPSLGN